MLSLENVTIKRGEKVVIDGANLKVESGEIVLIRGGSGSGKSTLLNCIAGRLRYSGRIEIDNADLKSRAARIAVTHLRDPFEGDEIADSLTVKQYFQMLRIVRGADELTIVNTIKILTELGFNRNLDLQIGELSGIERRKVAITGSLSQTPKLLLLDRPTLGMTVAEKEDIIANLLAIKSKGCAILIATTEAEELISTAADRAYSIKEGKLMLNEKVSNNFVKTDECKEKESEMNENSKDALALHDLADDIIDKNNRDD